jgi:hypothetical protein
MWVDLDTDAKKAWDKLSKEAFQACRSSEEPLVQKAAKKKISKARGVRLESMPEIEALILELLESADLEKTSVTQIRTELGKTCDPKVLLDNKAAIRQYITAAVKQIQQR